MIELKIGIPEEMISVISFFISERMGFMARELAKAFYKSKQWRQCRAAYISRRIAIDAGMCESCHEKPGYIVHHKIELTPENINNPDIALGFGNLKYDCTECHNQENGRGDINVPGMVQYTFGTDGEIVVLPPCEQGAFPSSGPPSYLDLTHGSS